MPGRADFLGSYLERSAGEHAKDDAIIARDTRGLELAGQRPRFVPLYVTGHPY
jgi:hypothetical protein